MSTNITIPTFDGTHSLTVTVPKTYVEEGFVLYEDTKTLTVVTSGPIRLVKDPSDVPTDVPLPQGLDLVVLADVVTVHGYLRAPGRNVTIIARTIATEVEPNPPKPDPTFAALNVSGADGQSGNPQLTPPTMALATGDPPTQAGQGNKGTQGDVATAGQAAPGVAGLNGQDSGNITVFCNDTLSGTSLGLRVAGGRGGDGQDGQGGQNGGQGGPGTDEAVGWAGGTNPTVGSPGGDGGLGGQGGNAGYGGSGGQIVFRALTATAAMPWHAPDGLGAGADGRPGQGGRQGLGGPGGIGGKEATIGYSSGGTTSSITPGQVQRKPSGAQGKPAADADRTTAAPGSVNKRTPGPSVAGTFSATPLKRSDAGPGFTDSAFSDLRLFGDPPADGVHVDLLAYLEMQLDQAEYDYVSMKVPVDQWTDDAVSAAAVADASARAQWVQDLSGALSSSGLAAAAGPDLDSNTARLEAISRRADALVNNMTLGLDLFGHHPNWVPTLSLDYYEEQLFGSAPGVAGHGALDVYAQAETACATTLSNLIKDMTATEVRKMAAAAAASRIAALSDEAASLRATSATLLTSITAQHAAAKKLHDDVQAAITAWSAHEVKVNTALSLKQVFDTVGQFAFFPDEGSLKTFRQVAMVAGQTGSSLSTLAQGDPDTTWLINELSVASDKFKSLDEAFEQQAQDGSITLDDPQGQCLLAQQADFDTLCDKYFDSSSDAVTARNKMDDYVDAVQLRNRSILQYNATLARLASALAAAQSAQHLAGLVTDDQAAATRQGLATSAGQAAMVLTDRRIECIRLIYEADRAFSLVTLQSDLTFHDVLGLAAPTAIDSTAANTAAINLVQDRRADIDNHTPGQSIPTGQPGAPYDYKRDGGVVVVVTADDEPDFIAGLMAGKGQVTLDAVDLSAADGPFHQMFNVRIRAVRCWLHGFAAMQDPSPPGGSPIPNPVHEVQLTHTGDSTFLKTDGALDLRSHDVLTVDFRYNADRSGPNDSYRGVWDPDLRGVTDGLLYEAQHILVSPFATWHVELPQVTTMLSDGSTRAGDASALTEVRFEFFVDYGQSRQGDG
jgi:hypothetical protein